LNRPGRNFEGDLDQLKNSKLNFFFTSWQTIALEKVHGVEFSRMPTSKDLCSLKLQ